MLQKHNQVDRQRSKGNNSHFFLPQILLLIFRFLSGCGNANSRMKIIRDLLDLLDSNPSNIEALVVRKWCTIDCLCKVLSKYDVIDQMVDTGIWMECLVNCFTEA